MSADKTLNLHVEIEMNSLANRISANRETLMGMIKTSITDLTFESDAINILTEIQQDRRRLRELGRLQHLFDAAGSD